MVNGNSSQTVMVLDGETRAALAVVRSLGRAGLRVIVASETDSPLAGASRYACRSVHYPSPEKGVTAFAQTLRDLVLQERPDTIFPITDATVYSVLRHRSLFDGLVTLPLPDIDDYWAASNKMALTKSALKLGVPCPGTIFIGTPSASELQRHLWTLTFPVIVKPAASIRENGDGFHKTSVRFAASRGELVQIVSEDPSFNSPYMLQEVVFGEGVGIFALCDKGEMVAVFSHRRIREKPPWGGVSAVCESTTPDAAALDYSKKLLKTIGWSGVAMVEFKRDSASNGIPKLMEINARFWGSLQLAINAGVNFPLLLYQQAKGEKVNLATVLQPARSRWLLGDLDHLWICLKTAATDSHHPMSLKAKYRVAGEFVAEFFRKSTIEELCYGDVGPFWRALKLWWE